jgi:hypothetical protein
MENKVFEWILLSEFYSVNYHCITSPKATTSKNHNENCVLQQSNQLAQHNVAVGASASTWPTSILCSECTQRQYAFTSLHSSLELFANLSRRTNPMNSIPFLIKTCGVKWIKRAKATNFNLVLDELQDPMAEYPSAAAHSLPDENAPNSASFPRNRNLGTLGCLFFLANAVWFV